MVERAAHLGSVSRGRASVGERSPPAKDLSVDLVGETRAQGTVSLVPQLVVLQGQLGLEGLY